ncbi:hypothetical protein CCP3SC1_30057 [Gammaproteobacteria bacterium]
MDKRLLVAVNDSLISNAALLKAIELARENNFELRLAHVVDNTIIPWEEQGVTRRQHVLNTLARTGERILQDAQETTRRTGCQASSVQLVRDRWSESIGELIAAEAKNWGADLIVIGSERYHPIRRILFSSVDSDLMRATPIPVLPVITVSGSKPLHSKRHLNKDFAQSRTGLITKGGISVGLRFFERKHTSGMQT